MPPCWRAVLATGFETRPCGCQASGMARPGSARWREPVMDRRRKASAGKRTGMMDTKDNDRKGKTLGLRSGGTETSHVRQSFSHGRTKSVTVEHKRKRILVPKPGAPAGSGPNAGRTGSTANLSDAEFER